MSALHTLSYDELVNALVAQGVPRERAEARARLEVLTQVRARVPANRGRPLSAAHRQAIKEGLAASRDHTDVKGSSEHADQVALFSRAMEHEDRIPELRGLYATPNAGKRSRRVGYELKREGLRPGMLDVCLPLPRGGYGALYIEMKRPGNGPSADQLAWAGTLRALGNRVEFCWGTDAAWDVILDYLEYRDTAGVTTIPSPQPCDNGRQSRDD